MKKYLSVFAGVLFFLTTHAQWGGMGGKGSTNLGHFYGKVIDSATGKPIPFAAVQLMGPKWDSASQSLKTIVIAGQLTKENGEFSLEKLSVMSDYTIQISAIGYGLYEQKISFSLSKMMKQGQKMQQGGGDMSSVASLINAIDKDLGNIMLKSDAAQIGAVTVDGSAPQMELKMDKRVFDVSKSITTTGGTAEDVLKNVPAVTVDIDGNVKLRNASPQIYVDGMPTTLTIDQIPADDIDKIEIITNPSAKYDASAGSGGIINIVLKQNRKLGYNGSIRAGIDERGKINGGLDLNVRQSKINVFGSFFYHQIDHLVYGQTERDNFIGNPLTNIIQKDTNHLTGNFIFGRGGFDWFIDNRNTLTISGLLVGGAFTTDDMLHTTTDTIGRTSSSSYRHSTSQRTFNTKGASLLYKHLFPKEDEVWTANGSYYQGASTSAGNYSTQYYDVNNNPVGSQILQQQQGGGTHNYIIGKTDYSDPLSKKIKIETGVQAIISQFSSQSNNFIYNYPAKEYVLINVLSSNYTFNQQVYAGYLTYSQDVSSRLSFQAGLRAESSYYTGKLADSSSYANQYPFSLFPSAYITYHLSDEADLQLNYSRHINRPGFMQLIPFIDYSDSLNLKEGNPNLKPEFSNSLEFNYLQNFDRKNSFMVSVYYKNTTDLITMFQQQQFIPALDRIAIINTYQNANSAYSYGAEFTSQNSLWQWLDVTGNFNLFKSGINGQNIGGNTVVDNNLISWFAKLNLTFKLPQNFSLQLNGIYLSKAVIPAAQGGRWGGWGGGGWGGGITPSSQGYILPNYSMDVALKKEFLKNKAASLTLNVKDVFATGVSASSTTTPYFTQTTSRIKDRQFFRITFSYRFGQTDFSLFKKKNMNMDTAPMQDMNGGDSGN